MWVCPLCGRLWVSGLAPGRMLAVKDQMHFCTFWMAKFVEGHFVLLLVQCQVIKLLISTGKVDVTSLGFVANSLAKETSHLELARRKSSTLGIQTTTRYIIWRPFIFLLILVHTSGALRNGKTMYLVNKIQQICADWMTILWPMHTHERKMG